MKSRIVYYVASSIDGFISGPNGDISKFVPSGEVVDHYLADLNSYETVIMGRKTYEFGYQYGLVPGQPAYKHMTHYIFSELLNFENKSEQVYVEKLRVQKVLEIKNEAETDIYLCGGGQLAGWLLDQNLIDVVKLKLNPIILGEGVPLFSNSKASFKGELTDSQSFEDGVLVLTYSNFRGK